MGKRERNLQGERRKHERKGPGGKSAKLQPGIHVETVCTKEMVEKAPQRKPESDAG